MLIKDKIKAIGYSYLLFIGIGLVLTMIIRSIDTFLVVNYYKIPSLLNHDVLKSIRALTNNSFYIMFLAAFFVPTVEETMFRLWLSFEPRHIAISFSAILTYLIFGLKDLFNVNLNALAIILSFIVISLVIFRALRDKHTEQYLGRFISIRVVGSISAISFGLVHITNFTPINMNIWFLYPIYVLPQVVLGYLIVFLRLKHGFTYGLGLHILVNFIAVLMKL